ncbi:RNA polymerase sigma factor [Sphingobacterium bovisgrunnientis]|jgi:RNA polymerase sigma-70 factor (family 1)|uniref:RNA polymerase sigma factor n=1 Tax=Sphingobacterium bovisgrunnientis TaxID=1874697 RepID=UPI00135C6A93|nr:sigma-70 family RNA polymerase sigma factor [Sphingobacterium bovisgrunnientis]
MSTAKSVKQEFDKHYQNLCFFAYTLLGDHIMAEDFVQEAFLTLFTKFDTITPNENVYKSFLYTSVKNSILNWHRRAKVESKYHELTPFEDIVYLDFDNAMIKTEAIAEVNKLISNLPSACQQIFRLYYLDGLSSKEIASKLNISINTIKTQKLRGLKYIQSKLNPEYFLVFLFLLK